MILIKNITLKNFLSIGNVTQAVDFDKKDLTLILGENLDLGGDGARNGTGKTTLIQGLCYALFGVPINNIRKDNLVNRTNAKGMLVTLEFSVNGTNYKIERGRKPNILKFYVNDVQQKQDEDAAQGENKETQALIQKIINMTPDMFRHIVVLNTYSEPFLALKNNEQREIIEQLLGITLLSEKADVVKDLIRQSKDDIQQEEFKVKAIEEANKRVKEQIDAVKRRQKLWQSKHDSDLVTLATEYDELIKIDIDKELQAHKDLVVWNKQKEQQDAHLALVARHTAWKQKQDKDIKALQTKMDVLSHIDFTVELQAHKDLSEYSDKRKSIDDLNKLIATCENLCLVKYFSSSKYVSEATNLYFKAKQFGISLEQADKISESLLDFESSISNELSAELITGKQLNLEQARLYALNNDMAGLSRELANCLASLTTSSLSNFSFPTSVCSTLGSFFGISQFPAMIITKTR